MTTAEKIILTTFLLISNFGMSQNVKDPLSATISGIGQLYHIADTLFQDNSSVTMKIVWMDSVVEIRKTTSLKYDLAYHRKFRQDSLYTPTQKDTLSYNALRRIGSQNCHSYALEKYFKYHHIADNELFNNMTVVTENRYMGNILATSFRKTKTISTKPRKNLKFQFTEGSLLVFRNEWNIPIHTVFYDGQFHSKYGGWPAKAEKELKPIFDRYWDTTTIEEYQFDMDGVCKYLAHSRN